MARLRIWILGLVLLLAAAPAGWAGPTKSLTAEQMAARIDELITAGLTRLKVKPAALTDDSAFLRRVSLDVVGKVPPVTDVRKFLADPASNKRRRAVDRLLDSPGYVNNFTNIWRDLLLPEANADFQRRYLVPGVESWLRKQFADNRPWNHTVRELLTVPLANSRDAMRQGNFGYSEGGASPLTFYMAKEGKAENLAATTARLFLGVRIECAQCHDHPFGRWTREQFWGQAAFFAGIRNNGNNFFAQLSESNDRRELAIPNTERVAQARFLDDTEPRWRYKVSPRIALADWMTTDHNPFFARATVNRIWGQFFGLGIVDPVDDFNDNNLPSHPELLDELARQFVAHRFDLKYVIRAITMSKTYQRSSVWTGPGRPDRHLFARMPVKGLTSHQLFDSLIQATGYRDPLPPQQRFFAFGTPRQEFMDKFASQEKRTEQQTSIPQALALMNNPLIVQLTDVDRSEVLAAVVNSPFMTTAGQVETLYLSTLSRKPRPDEVERFVRYVEKGGAASNKKKALADVFWALLNSTEFMFNH